jgi:hypothetical protein
MKKNEMNSTGLWVIKQHNNNKYKIYSASLFYILSISWIQKYLFYRLHTVYYIKLVLEYIYCNSSYCNIQYLQLLVLRIEP